MAIHYEGQDGNPKINTVLQNNNAYNWNAIKTVVHVMTSHT